MIEVGVTLPCNQTSAIPFAEKADDWTAWDRYAAIAAKHMLDTDMQNWETVARHAGLFADAMMAERGKQQSFNK